MTALSKPWRLEDIDVLLLGVPYGKKFADISGRSRQFAVSSPTTVVNRSGQALGGTYSAGPSCSAMSILGAMTLNRYTIVHVCSLGSSGTSTLIQSSKESGGSYSQSELWWDTTSSGIYVKRVGASTVSSSVIPANISLISCVITVDAVSNIASLFSGNTKVSTAAQSVHPTGNLFSSITGSTVTSYCNLMAVIRGVVNDQIAFSLANNPFQLLKKQREVIYFPTGSVTIPTLSSPGVTNILTTSATPQVTLTF